MDFLILCHIIYSDCASHPYGFLFTQMERWQCIYTGMMDFLILCHIIYSDCAHHRYGFLFTPVDGAVAVYLYWHDGLSDSMSYNIF